MKYRIKTADVDAWQWDGLLPASWEDAPEWVMQAWREGRIRFDENGDNGAQRMLLATSDRETWMIAEEGYWVVRYEDGGLTAVTPGRFAEKFEAVPRAEESVVPPCGAARPLPVSTEDRLGALARETDATAEIRARPDGGWSVSALMRVGPGRVLAYHCVYGETADEALSKAERIKGV
jgi:hypothetical protein